MIIVVDSGIWISAIEFGGIPAKALELLIELDDLAMCAEIEEEVLRILREKFRRDPNAIRERMSPFWNGALRLSISGEVRGVSRDAKDDFILECARNARADLLISGDNDLLSLKEYAETRIITARQYLDMSSERQQWPQTH